MADFAISAVARKSQATANGSTTQFSFAFSVNVEADIAVFVNTTQKTISTHYTVSITSSTGAGSITFTSGNTPSSGQIVTIMSKTALARASVYTSGGTINAAALEGDFDTNMMLFQQQDERLDRTLSAPVNDAASINMTLPDKDARKGAVLGFNATSGNPEAGPKIADVETLSAVTANIARLGTTTAVADMAILATDAIVADMAILGTDAIVADMAILATDAIVADMAILATDAIVADMAILGTNDVVADMAILGTSDIVTDMNLLATAAVVEDMGLLATSAVIQDMGLLATSAVIEDMGLLATSAVIEDMGLLATSAVIEDMGLLASSATVADLALLGTSAVVSDLAILATNDVVTDMNVLATSDIVNDMNVLGTSANVTAMNLLGTSAVVEDMGLLSASAVIEDMGLLSAAAVIQDMGLLATSAVIEDMGLLATSAVIEDMGLLATSAVIEDIGILGTSANVTAMSNVSGAISNVNTVAGNISDVNNFADTYHGAASSDPSSNLNTGDLYFSTSASAMKVYNGSSWIVATSSGSTSLLNFEYLATSGQTSFSGSDTNSATLAYTVNNIIVSLNGVILDGGGNSDYTSSNGTSVVLGVGASAGDILSVVAFKSFTTADMVPASSGGTYAANVTMATNKKLVFRDSAISISSTDDGDLSIAADDEIDITSTLIDVNGNLDVSGTALITGVVTSNGGAVFNEGSADVDFRVESNGNANMLFVDGGNNRVGIGTSTVDQPLHVEGSVSGDDLVIKIENTNTATNSRASAHFTTANGTWKTSANRSGGFIFNAPDGDEVAKIDNDGIVTMPLQPAFLVRKNADQNNLAVNTVDITFQTEIFDQNADFASNAFTAPVTGRYQLNAQIRLDNVDTAADYYQIKILTSNRELTNIFDPGVLASDAVFWTLNLSQLCDMDASDTAKVQIRQVSGSAQTDIGNNGSSWFSGYLVA